MRARGGIAAPDAALTRSVGRYEIGDEVAGGGMANIHLARTHGPGGFVKVVALKVIHPHLAREEGFIGMFLDEARIASRVVHQNVCSVFDVGHEDGVYFMAMEYLQGESLLALIRGLRGGEAPPGWPALAAHLVAEAAAGLHAAHELTADDGAPLGLVHRDVSPHNVFVTYDGHVKVVDFGVAKARGRLTTTATGQVKGKLSYMSPEQLRGGEVDRRTDVWALGVVLWETLTRERLFRRSAEGAVVLSILSDEIRAPSTLTPSVPPELDAIVARALERDPERRFATAQELRAALLGAMGPTLPPEPAARVRTLMEELFAGRRRTKAEAVRAVRAGEPRPGDAVEPEPDAPASRVTRRMEDDPTVPASGPRRIERRRRLLPLAVTGGLAALIGFGLAMLDGPSARDEGSVATPPPAAREPAAPSDERPTPRAPDTLEPAPAASPAEVEAPRPPEPAPEPRVGRPAASRSRVSRPTPERSMERSADRSSATRPPTPPPASSGAQTGAVAVATPGGWADIYVDGRRVGRAPGRVTLPAGRRVLTLHPFGRRDAAIQRSVDVVAGGQQRLQVAVSPP